MSEQGLEKAKKLVTSLLESIGELHENGEIEGFAITGAIITEVGPIETNAESFLMGIGVSRQQALVVIQESFDEHSNKIDRMNFGMGEDLIQMSVEAARKMHGDNGPAVASGLIAGIEFILNRNYPEEVITKGLVYNTGIEYLRARKGENLTHEEIQSFTELVNTCETDSNWATDEEAIGYTAKCMREDFMQKTGGKARPIPWSRLMVVAKGLKRDLYIDRLNEEQIAGILQVGIETSEDMR